MSRRASFKIDFDLDLQFWHLVPSVNINLHTRNLEFEWLCFGIYAGRIIEPPKRPNTEEFIRMPKAKGKSLAEEILKDYDFLRQKHN